MTGSNNCWHCGVPLERAAKYIGIVDVIFGGISTIILSIHVSEIYNDTVVSGDVYANYYKRSFPGLANLPRELAVIMLVTSATQAVMGVVLYIGAMNKSRSICQFWLVTAALTMLFTGILLRLWEMFVVNELSRELKEEQEVTYFTGQAPYPQAEPHQMAQQLPQYVQHQPTDKYPHQGLGLGMVVPPPSGPSVISGVDGGGYSQLYHQPVVAAPVTNLYGVQVHGNGSQYSSQPSYNPATQTANPTVPAALQPPPRYDALEGTGGYSNGAYSNSAKEGEANGFSTSFAKF